MSDLICWGHNPGQRFVKDAIGMDSRRDLRPYPAVIAPWAASDDTGLAAKTKDLTATVGGAHYIGGHAAERLPLANRQMANGRLEPNSPMYQALAQMSAQHAGLIKKGKPKPAVLIATALPVAWRNDWAEAAIEGHVRDGLKGLVDIRGVYVQSEPNAVVSYELLDDNGQPRREQAALATGLVCVGDLGGATLNRSVLEGLRALPGQAASPLLGSRQVVEALMLQSGQQYIDAEKRLEAAVREPGKDGPADQLLKQYREAVLGELQRAWSLFKPVAYLFAGGTAHWVADELRRAFGARARIVANPQQAIAIGLWRYARRKARALRGAA